MISADNMFFAQLRTLIMEFYPKNAGMGPDEFIKIVAPLKEQVFRYWQDYQESPIPFLIVIPKGLVPLERQMSRLRVTDSAAALGGVVLDVSQLADVRRVKPTKTPYLIFDVEPGEATSEYTIKDCLRLFRQNKRLGLTVEEGIALLTHYQGLLKKHYINLTGTRYGKEAVPHIWINQRMPELTGYRVVESKSVWGSPSCAKRII